MKRALIFGIAGYTGQNLAKELKNNGYEVIGCDLKYLQSGPLYDGFYRIDVTDAHEVNYVIDRVNPTHIFNLTDIGGVGQSWKNPQLAVAVNITGVINILEACKSFLMKPRILLVGTADQYAPSEMPLNEESKLGASSPYGISKQAHESLAKMYHAKYDMPIYCVRVFNYIGVGQNEKFVIPQMAKQAADLAKAKKDGTIYVGNIHISRDFLDVRDLVKAYRIVIESSNPEEIYNIGYGISYPIDGLLNYILGLANNVKVDVKVDDNLLRPTDNKYVCCDRSKITKRLGWNPEYNIYNTIKDIYNSYLESK